jgi:hypothetical protein
MAITISGDVPNFSAATITALTSTTGTVTTLTTTTISDGTNSTSSTNAIQGSAKAWVSWNGSTGAIRASYNVGSITKNSAGNFTANFTTAFADTSYCFTFGVYNDGAVGSGANFQVVVAPSGVTTSSLRVITGCPSNGGSYDSIYTCISVFR